MSVERWILCTVAQGIAQAMTTLHEKRFGLFQKLVGCRSRHTIDVASQPVGDVGEVSVK